MANYVKIWTDCFHDPWFVGLNCQQRGVWLQLIILAKSQGDSGCIVFRSWATLGQQLGMDRSTLGRLVRRFQQDMHIKLYENDNKTHTIELLQYEYNQTVKTPADHKNAVEISTDNEQEKRPIREDKIREDKNIININNNLTEISEEENKKLEIQAGHLKELILYDPDTNKTKWVILVRSGISTRNPIPWLVTMIANYGYEKVEAAVHSIAKWYNSRDVTAPSDMGKAREKFDNWCQSQKDVQLTSDNQEIFTEEQNEIIKNSLGML